VAGKLPDYLGCIVAGVVIDDNQLDAKVAGRLGQQMRQGIAKQRRPVMGTDDDRGVYLCDEISPSLICAASYVPIRSGCGVSLALR
jgi:hypothetical protein